MTAKQRIVPDRFLPQIHPPSDKDFYRFCDGNKIPEDARTRLRASFLLLADLAETTRLDQVDREIPKHQIQQLLAIARRLKNAAKYISQFDTLQPMIKPWEVVEPEALQDLAEETAKNLGGVLTAEFIHQHDRRPKPGRGTVAGKISQRTKIEGSIAANPGRVMWDLLLLLSKTFATSAMRLKARTLPGPKPLRVLPTMLQNLCADYHRLGRKPTKKRTGGFPKFVRGAVAIMGLDGDFDDRQLFRAVENWRKGPQRLD